MTKRYDTHEMSVQIRNNILKYAGDLTRYEQKSVESAILQVEALYIFAIMKSTLSSQRQDPFIKNLLMQFRVALDSPALLIEP